MKQFNLHEWLQDKSRKVVTRDGRPVRIICTDRKSRSGNIVGLVGEYESLIYVWNNDGKHIVSEIPDNDLFFADEEEELTELTEFEKAMIQFSHERNSLIQFKHTPEEINAHLYRYSEKLLDLARKEILKDLPKWKKITKREQNYLAYGYLSNEEYYLSVKELIKNLPKEE